MYFTDRGIEELETRRGDDDFAVAWLAERMRDFVNLNPEFDVAMDRFATWLARLDEEDEDLFLLTAAGRAPPAAPDISPFATERRLRVRPGARAGYVVRATRTTLLGGACGTHPLRRAPQRPPSPDIARRGRNRNSRYILT